MPPNTSLQNYDASLPKLPVPQSQPDWLAVIARMRGMQPADVEQSNVLELGCGDGGNLIPLAERYPQGKFVGIDDSARQIATARQEVDALRLGNLELRHESLFDFEAAPGAFDYIIADGIYSWVEPESRDRLLAICRDHLAPKGVAFISYRVHPGWQVHELLGSMMRFEARGSKSVAQQLAAGRMLLDFLRAALPGDDNSYGSLMRSELDGVLQQSDEFLRRNYLQEATGGIYFRQFVAHAKRHALQFLGDCTAGILYGDPLHEAAERALTAAASDFLEVEQIRDIVRNRSHRQTLLCHDQIKLQQALSAERLRGLYLEGRFVAQDAQMPIDSTAINTFVGANGVSVSTGVPSTKVALAHLSQVWPGSIIFEELVAATCERLAEQVEEGEGPPSSVPPAENRRLEGNLLRCCAGEIVHLQTTTPSFSPTVSERPTASQLVRLQAARGDLVTNRKHEPLRLDILDRHVVQYLDGSRNFAQILDELAASAAGGHIAVVEFHQPVEDSAARTRVLGELVTESLQRLANHALLIG